MRVRRGWLLACSLSWWGAAFYAVYLGVDSGPAAIVAGLSSVAWVATEDK